MEKFLGDTLIFCCAIIIACGIVYATAMFNFGEVGLFLALLFLAWFGKMWEENDSKKS